jgi:hypothetical protein
MSKTDKVLLYRCIKSQDNFKSGFILGTVYMIAKTYKEDQYYAISNNGVIEYITESYKRKYFKKYDPNSFKNSVIDLLNKLDDKNDDFDLMDLENTLRYMVEKI